MKRRIRWGPVPSSDETMGGAVIEDGIDIKDRFTGGAFHPTLPCGSLTGWLDCATLRALIFNRTTQAGLDGDVGVGQADDIEEAGIG